MEENKDKKTNLTGKLQLKKTFNAGQIKQNFSHGRSKSVSVEVKKKRTFSTINKQNNDNQNEEREVLKDDQKEIKKIHNDPPKVSREGIRDLNVKHTPKKPVSKPIQEQKKNQNDLQQELPEKSRPQKFTKSPKSFENRRQGKLTISVGLILRTKVNPPKRTGARLSACCSPLANASPNIAKSSNLLFLNGLPSNSFTANTAPAELAALLPIPLPGFIFFSIFIMNPFFVG